MEKWFSANSHLLFSSTVFLGTSSLGIVVTKESHSMSSIRNPFCLWFVTTKAPYVTSGDEAIVLQPFPFCTSIVLQTMSIYALNEFYNSQYCYKILLLPSSNKGIFATSKVCNWLPIWEPAWGVAWWQAFLVIIHCWSCFRVCDYAAGIKKAQFHVIVVCDCTMMHLYLQHKHCESLGGCVWGTVYTSATHTLVVWNLYTESFCTLYIYSLLLYYMYTYSVHVHVSSAYVCTL